MAGADAARRAFARRWIVALGLYALVLALSPLLIGRTAAGYWTSGALVVAISVALAVRSGLGPSFFGVTLDGARQSLIRAIVPTAAILASGFAALAWLRAPGPLEAGAPAPPLDVELVAYVLLSAPLQEFVFRGLFQRSARYLLAGSPRAGAYAVSVSTTAYAAAHLPWGLPAAVAMIGPGIVWGLQFERDRSLVGVTVSHAIVGYVFVGAAPLWRALLAQAA